MANPKNLLLKLEKASAVKMLNASFKHVSIKSISMNFERPPSRLPLPEGLSKTKRNYWLGITYLSFRVSWRERESERARERESERERAWERVLREREREWERWEREKAGKVTYCFIVIWCEKPFISFLTFKTFFGREIKNPSSVSVPGFFGRRDFFVKGLFSLLSRSW